MHEADEILKNIKRVHFVGIGGSGICPIAEILHSRGYIITGSDNNEGDTLDRMTALGIKTYLGHDAKNVGDAEAVIYSAAIPASNPELVWARENNIPTLERSKAFGALTRDYKHCIGICGTHGKTTTSAMLTQVLIEAQVNPSALIGGKLKYTGTNGIVGSDELFVCEACEFNNTFLELSPTCAVILNIDADHLEFFKTMDNLKSSFTKFAAMAQTVIYNGDDENTVDAVKKLQDKTLVSFGFGENVDWRADNITVHDGAYYEFDVIKSGEKRARVKLAVPGRHNIYNALACMAASDNEGVGPGITAPLISDFTGAGRRFEKLGEFDGVTIADDYAHHPTELEATLTAAKQMSYKRVIAVFQPYTFSRTSMHLEWFARVLKIADMVILTPIMGGREINTWGVKSEDLAALLDNCTICETFRDVADYAESIAESGDLIITLGCGDIYKAAKLMVKDYREKHDK